MSFETGKEVSDAVAQHRIRPGSVIVLRMGIPTGQPPVQTQEGRIIPTERHGLKVMSMGMLTEDDNPAILRGPMVGKYLKMFVGGVQWGPLDYLILDLPPGTRGASLTR